MARSSALSDDAALRQDQAEGRMTIIEHLAELRSRIVWSLGSLLAGTAVALVPAVNQWLFETLRRPAVDAGATIVQIDPVEGIGVFIQISLLLGFILALPIILYQLIMFINPGLLPNEKRLLYQFLPFAVVSFLCGVLFAYFILLPPAIEFLFTFAKKQGLVDNVTIQIGKYYDLVVRLLFWIGISFLTPVFMLILGRVGILTYGRAAPFRRYAYVAAWLVAAIITPTVDPVNLSLVALPLMGLFELGLQLVRIFGRRDGIYALS